MNNRAEDKCGRNISADVVIGTKRSMSENWGRTNPCKRSRQTTQSSSSTTTTFNRNAAVDGERCYKKTTIFSPSHHQQQQHQHQQDTATAALSLRDVRTTSPVDRTSSVLLNLLVNGCDLKAGYVCMSSTVKNRLYRVDRTTTTTTQQQHHRSTASSSSYSSASSATYSHRTPSYAPSNRDSRM